METYSDRSESEGEEDEEREETGSEEEDDEEDEAHDDDMDEDEAPSNKTSSVKDHRSTHSSTSASREGSNIVITLNDPRLLDCPICFEPLTVPVLHCDQNGHIACSLFCTKINYKCPSCSCHIRSYRCRAIENVLESSTTPCRNMKYGCNIPVTCNKKNEHEKTCVFSPCSCPCVGCDFVSSTKELYRHFSNDHLYSTNSGGLDFSFPISITIKKNDSFLVLREKQWGTLFVLHNCIEILGNVVAVSCIQPSFMDDFNYELLVTNKGSSLMFRSVTTSTPSLQVVNGSPSRNFLLIPCEFFTCGRVNIDVTIWRKC